MIDKKQMTEEDIKLNFITPALIGKGWQDKITMETAVRFTDGKINLRGNIVTRKNPKKADYILYASANNPIAIVEAKDNNHKVADGIQQAMEYAQMMDIPFAYSSNGDGFYEHDFLTGQEREFPLSAFPTPDELRTRLEVGANEGQGLSDAEKKIADQPYYTSAKTYPPRYYQRNAVNRTVDAIARGQQRLLLVMATGTGKTYTAFQIVYRLLKSGMKKKVLYLADRNILVDQSIQQDFSPLEKTIHKINFAKDDPTTVTSHEVYFSLYQQLTDREDEADDTAEDETVSRLASLFQRDFFDLVIVDECHRGSAKRDSSWRKILDYFSSATQIGMTATPKETRYISNIDYFGEPVYTYSLREGIEDGFLAPFKVYDAKEQDWDMDEDNFQSIIPEECRWQNWAADDQSGSAMTGDTLLNFVNNVLFPVLKGQDVKDGDHTIKGIAVTPDTPIKKSIVKSTFEDANNYMKDGVLLRQVINVIDELDLGDYEESHAFGEI